MSQSSIPTRRSLPLILVRGFGGLGVEDEKKIAYQGFNDGTVYPQKRGENYIYEGLILRFMKSNWEYHDATGVVGYYSSTVEQNPIQHQPENIRAKLKPLEEKGFFSGSKIIIDPTMALRLIESKEDPCQTLWVFRYYDLNDRQFKVYGEALVRLIDFIRELAVLRRQPDGQATDSAEKPMVNIIAHSMGGLIVREAVQLTYHEQGRKADQHINKIVTLGTPHRGIIFQILKSWIGNAAEEMKHFNPDFQEDITNPAAYKNFERHFPVERLLCVVGTNYRSYAITPSSWLNRVFSAPEEYGPNYNRSDGLVKQISAQIPGASRTFVHKCHSGYDSLVTARESFEVATRFFFGDVRARLRLVSGKVTRGKDLFGKSEFFLGVSVKPRYVDFELFYQSKEAENCYGPFSEADPKDKNVDFREKMSDLSFPWADANKLIWEGYLTTNPQKPDMVMRLEFYVGERDLFGIGFSDNLIFSKQYYIRAVLEPSLELYLYTGEEFADEKDPLKDAIRLDKTGGGWNFQVEGTGFTGTFRIELDEVPETGQPRPLLAMTVGPSPGTPVSPEPS